MSDSALDPTCCPLCGQTNQCAMELARATGSRQPNCWCTRVSFSRNLIEQLLPQASGKVCICRACAEQPAD